MHHVVKVDIWSDVACPWCYIGKRRFEAGVAAFSRTPGAPSVTAEYHSFELSPDTPVEFEGTAADFLMQFKQLPRDVVNQMIGQVTAIAAQEGLAYDYESMQHTNTLRAHQLLHQAKAHGVQWEAKERLLRAYFIEGRHIGRIDELAALAGDVGLDPQAVARSLQADEYLDAVHADQRQARAYGINGVPFFVVDGRFGVSGAQPAEVFTRALQDAVAQRHQPA